MLTAVLRHLLTILAGMLAAKGLLADGQSSQFVDEGGAFALCILGLGWSWVQKQAAARNLIAALNTPPPKPPPP